MFTGLIRGLLSRAGCEKVLMLAEMGEERRGTLSELLARGGQQFEEELSLMVLMRHARRVVPRDGEAGERYLEAACVSWADGACRERGLAVCR